MLNCWRLWCHLDGQVVCSVLWSTPVLQMSLPWHLSTALFSAPLCHTQIARTNLCSRRHQETNYSHSRSLACIPSCGVSCWSRAAEVPGLFKISPVCIMSDQNSYLWENRETPQKYTANIWRSRNVQSRYILCEPNNTYNYSCTVWLLCGCPFAWDVFWYCPTTWGGACGVYP